jgi:uncharacterized membrane protein
VDWLLAGFIHLFGALTGISMKTELLAQGVFRSNFRPTQTALSLTIFCMLLVCLLPNIVEAVLGTGVEFHFAGAFGD